LLPGKIGNLLQHGLSEFHRGLSIVRQPRHLVSTLFWSLALWGTILLSYHVTFIAFGISPDWWWAPLTVSLVSLAVLLPAAPGYVGVFHLASVLALSLAGVPQSKALAVAVVINATELGLSVSLGLYYLARLGLPLPGKDALTLLKNEQEQGDD